MRHKLVVLGWWIAACSGGDSGQDAAPTLAIGSSVQSYAPLAEGGPLLLYRGPQGGYHVYLGVRVSGIDAGTPGETPRLCDDPLPATSPCVSFEVLDLHTARVIDGYVGLRVPLTPSPTLTGSHELVPPRLVPINVTSFDELDGHHLRVTSTVEDRNGVHVEATVNSICMAVR